MTKVSNNNRGNRNYINDQCTIRQVAEKIKKYKMSNSLGVLLNF